MRGSTMAEGGQVRELRSQGWLCAGRWGLGILLSESVFPELTGRDTNTESWGVGNEDKGF